MSADAESKIREPLPVAEVVPAFLTRPGEIADLVLTEPGRIQMFDGQVVGLSNRLILGYEGPFLLDLSRQTRSLFEVEHINRDMPGAALDCSVKRAVKRPGGLTRQTQDEIDTESHS